MTNPTITYYDDDGDEAELPAKYEVCLNCKGKGSHVNRAIDGNGLDEESLDDPEFMKDYMSGVYDVPCDECRGKRVVTVVDEARADPDELKAHRAYQCEMAECRAQELAEIAFGC